MRTRVGQHHLRLRWLAAAILLGLVPGGCGPGGSPDARRPGDPLRVVCTTGQVGDVLRNLGGEHVEVETLMGPGVDPHLYKATVGDRRTLNAADVIFYSGLHLEGRLAGVLEKLAHRQPAYAVTEDLHQHESDRLRKIPGSQDTYDPHVWFDVALWAKCAAYTAEKLIALDPDHAGAYRRNRDAYVAELEALDRVCKEQLAEIPKPQRVLVTAHDAFGYFGDAYDVEVRGMQGISTVDEADLKAVNELVDTLVGRKVKAVFVESSVSPRNIEALIEGCRVRGHAVVKGGQLYSDAMGPAGTPEATYVGVVKYNLRTIVGALK